MAELDLLGQQLTTAEKNLERLRKAKQMLTSLRSALVSLHEKRGRLQVDF